MKEKIAEAFLQRIKDGITQELLESCIEINEEQQMVYIKLNIETAICMSDLKILLMNK